MSNIEENYYGARLDKIFGKVHFGNIELLGQSLTHFQANWTKQTTTKNRNT